jgi:hypothetical protein
MIIEMHAKGQIINNYLKKNELKKQNQQFKTLLL